GEFGIGALANRLELGCDCLGEIRYLDGVVSDTRGEPITLENAICLHEEDFGILWKNTNLRTAQVEGRHPYPGGGVSGTRGEPIPLENAICLHEEDFGILWKHTNLRTGQVEVRRSRRMVISSIATVGNYEYGLFWYLYQDGSIELQIKMTGIVSTGAMAPGAEPEHGVLIAPELYAPNHQHWFNFRLDMMVDGLENSVHEVNSEAVPLGPANPHGNAWVAKHTLLARESAAQRRGDPLAGRYWAVPHPGAPNPPGQPVGYKLVP